jgi:glycosyltransferase involved in cell wall biosynthesis
MHKELIKSNYNSFILVPKDSPLDKKLNQENLPYYTYTQCKLFKPHRQPGLRRAIEKIIKNQNINVIHCNRAKDTILLKNIPSSVKKIFTRHATTQIKTKYLKLFDTVIGVNKDYVEKTKELNLNKLVEHIPPFFNFNEFENFKPTHSKSDFFKNEFGIILHDLPTVAMVATLKKHKNHELILQALAKLVHQKNKPINLVLCGDGYRKKVLIEITKKLNISKYVFFLGFSDKRLEVMYHSDIKILVTKREAWGIVMMEAALLGKPLIGPTKTGMQGTTIVDKKTGLLFENGNVNDLVEKIEFLIDNPNLRKEYGENAYHHVKNNLLPEVLMKNLKTYYKELT